MKKLASKILKVFDQISYELRDYTIVVGGGFMSIGVFYSILSSLFKKNKYIQIISLTLGLLTIPAWEDLAMLIRKKSSHFLQDLAFIINIEEFKEEFKKDLEEIKK